jgi:hypothetical protein
VARVAYDAELEAAPAAVEAERRAHAEWEAALAARNDALRALYTAAGDDASQNELARRAGVTPSTFRAETADLRRARRARGQ